MDEGWLKQSDKRLGAVGSQPFLHFMFKSKSTTEERHKDPWLDARRMHRNSPLAPLPAGVSVGPAERRQSGTSPAMPGCPFQDIPTA
jgi:hypothetical protein